MWPWRRRVEVVLAASAGDDVTAALTMILRYHRKRVTFEEVRRAIYQPAHVEIASALEVVHAAEHFRMHTRGLRLEDPRAIVRIPSPSIVHMRADHGAFPRDLDKDAPGFFGVMVSASPTRVRWIDPYTGLVDDTYDDFFAYASGVFLEITKGDPIPRAWLG